jgi:hypothetical protein
VNIDTSWDIYIYMSSSSLSYDEDSIDISIYLSLDTYWNMVDVPNAWSSAKDNFRTRRNENGLHGKFNANVERACFWISSCGHDSGKISTSLDRQTSSSSMHGHGANPVQRQLYRFICWAFNLLSLVVYDTKNKKDATPSRRVNIE